MTRQGILSHERSSKPYSSWRKRVNIPSRAKGTPTTDHDSLYDSRLVNESLTPPDRASRGNAAPGRGTRDARCRRGRRFATRASIEKSTSAFFRASLDVSSRASQGSIAFSRPSIHRSVGRLRRVGDLSTIGDWRRFIRFDSIRSFVFATRVLDEGSRGRWERR